MIGVHRELLNLIHAHLVHSPKKQVADKKQTAVFVQLVTIAQKITLLPKNVRLVISARLVLTSLSNVRKALIILGPKLVALLTVYLVRLDLLVRRRHWVILGNKRANTDVLWVTIVLLVTTTIQFLA